MKKSERISFRLPVFILCSCLVSCGWFTTKPVVQQEDGRLDVYEDSADPAREDLDIVLEDVSVERELPGECVNDEDCDDREPCNGNETCSAEGRCEPGTPLPDGIHCSSPSVSSGICRGLVCSPPGCGNGEIDEGEDCDDGNYISGDGCENDCTYSCTRDRECRDSNICNGEETCSAGTHACEAGFPLADGYVCLVDPRSICLGGECIESVCGDSFVDPGAGEFCEPGLDPECNDDCTYGCTGSEDCPDDGNECNGLEYCNPETHECGRTDVPPDGTPCGISPATREICLGGSCQESICGDLFVDTGTDPPEECEDGNAADGDGCDNDCTYSCHDDGECDDGLICNGAEVCDAAVTHACRPGENAPSGTACDDGLFCTGIDECDGAGSCTGTEDPCNDGFSCTIDTCDEANDRCSNPIDGGYCLIGGVCTSHGDANPVNPCQACDAGTSQTDWTNLPDSGWGLGPPGCASGNQRCFGGQCRTCGSYLHEDGSGGLACWYLSASDGLSCDQVCSDHGGCVAGNWNDPGSCAVGGHFSARCRCMTGYSHPYAPGISCSGSYCYLRSPTVDQACGDIGSGECFLRLCVCNY